MAKKTPVVFAFLKGMIWEVRKVNIIKKQVKRERESENRERTVGLLK